MPNVLGGLFGGADRIKRKLGGLLSNPLENIALGSTRMAEDMNALSALASEAGYMPNTVNRADQSVLVSPQQNALARALLAEKATEMGGAMMGGTKFVYPQDRALRAAQRNAAKPISEGGLGLPANNSAADRAAAMGFNTDAWHGTEKAISGGLRRSSTGAQGPGAYLGDHPMVADAYAGDSLGANVLPALIRGKYANNMEFTGAVNKAGWKNVEQELNEKGFSGVHDSMFESAYNVFNPANIRSRFAAFDPMRRDSPDLLAGALPFTALTDEDSRTKLLQLLERHRATAK